jgi:hypothetical protein
MAEYDASYENNNFNPCNRRWKDNMPTVYRYVQAKRRAMQKAGAQIQPHSEM